MFSSTKSSHILLLILISFGGLLLNGWDEVNSAPSPTVAPPPNPLQPPLASVFQVPVNGVQVSANVVYGQGLQRNSWNETGGVPINLTLDVYQPTGVAGSRPSILLFHGGGFQGGGADFPNMVSTATFFAGRGWVVFSVDYRLAGDYGSVPWNWPVEPGPIVYPAGRDAKAAVRWVHANAAAYNISTDHITVLGGSAGGMLSLMLGASDAGDYRDELDVTADPTLLTTNLNASAAVQTAVVFWGDDTLLEGLESYDGRNRYDADDTPTLLIHGQNDTVVPVSQAQMVYQTLLTLGVPVEFHTLTGQGHAAWGATLDDGRAVLEAAFDFITDQQGLVVEMGFQTFMPLTN